MMDLMEAGMTKLEEEGSSGRRVLWIIAAGLGIGMTGGAIAGFLAESGADASNPPNASTAIVMAVFIAIIAGLAYSMWRNARRLKEVQGPSTRREKLNNQILAGSGIFGGLVALILVASGDASSSNPEMLLDGPIPPAIAIGVAFAFGILAPLVSWYWHARVVDEQEEAAYRSGALIAIYAFWYLAPVWWILWRGGMLPPPNGVAIYMMTTFIAVIVWFWKKYH
jgi:hypothetical protein